METTTSTTSILDLVKDLKLGQTLWFYKSEPIKLGDGKQNPFDIAMMSATNLSMNSMSVNIDSQLLKSICKDCVVTNELVWISMQNIANQLQSMKIAMFNLLQHLQIQQHQTQQL